MEEGIERGSRRGVRKGERRIKGGRKIDL